MKECLIEQEEKDGLDILHLDGSLDAHSYGRLESALDDLHEKGRHRVILDCTKLDYVSSVALGALIGFARRARENNGDMKLANLSPKVQNVIELLGFHKVLEIHAGIEQAFTTFQT